MSLFLAIQEYANKSEWGESLRQKYVLHIVDQENCSKTIKYTKNLILQYADTVTVDPCLSEPHLSESSFIRTHKFCGEYHYMFVNRYEYH